MLAFVCKKPADRAASCMNYLEVLRRQPLTFTYSYIVLFFGLLFHLKSSSQSYTRPNQDAPTSVTTAPIETETIEDSSSSFVDRVSNQCIMIYVIYRAFTRLALVRISIKYI